MLFFVILLLGIIVILAAMLMRTMQDLKIYQTIIDVDADNERICKESLENLLHNMFFFSELKNPQATYEELKNSMENARKGKDPEDKALADMYEKILNDIPPQWLEKN